MDGHSMLQVAAGLLVLTALGGLAMAGMRFAGRRNPPVWMTMAHGLLAAAGLTLLLYAAFVAGVPALATTAAVLFLIAAAGGLFLNLHYQWHHRLLPAWLVSAHAIVAVIALLLLLAAAFT